METLTRLRVTPQFSTFESKGRMQSMYVLFRPELTARNTLRFQNCATDDRMLIDCGEDDYPVGIQVILAEGMEIPSQSEAPGGDDTFNEISHLLFMFATEMIRYREASKPKRSNDLVGDILDLIKQVPPDKIKRCSY